jgi:hypothetical protein
MADALDEAAKLFIEKNRNVFGNTLLKKGQFDPKMDLSEGIITKKLYNQLTGLVSRFSRGSISPEDQKILDKYFPNLTKEQVIGDSIASRKAFDAMKPPTESTEKAELPSTPPVSTAQPTGPAGQQGTAGAGSGSVSTAERSSAYDLLVANQNPTMGWSDPNAKSSTAPTSRQTVLDKARETLKGDTYQLGSSSYLTAAREMKKPTPFTQRTDEQVTAANVVGRERIAGRERQAKADALGRARSRMRDVATAQKGAQQFFEDTGVTPKQVRALSGERMPERRRTYEAPRDPNVVRTEAPSKKFAGKTNVSYKSFSPNEANEIEKKRRRNR